MLIIPAIDLRAGRIVRLEQGDFSRETIYEDDPVRVATRWAELGAPWIHVVDLDGARSGYPAQLDIVQRIAQVDAFIELGGGLRTMDDLAAAFDAGVARAVIGTAAIENPAMLQEAVQRFGTNRIVLGVDARAGIVAVRGWEKMSEVRAHDIIQRAQTIGVENVIYTDIERDGTLSSPNFAAVAEVAQLGPNLIASGGVSTRDDLYTLAAIPGVSAAIVGKALYAEALTFAGPPDWWVHSGRLEGHR